MPAADTFIQVYGTNFDQWFPEIHWQYGYCYFWGTCECLTGCYASIADAFAWSGFTEACMLSNYSKGHVTQHSMLDEETWSASAFDGQDSITSYALGRCYVGS